MTNRRVPMFVGIVVLLATAACTTMTAGHAIPVPQPIRTTTSTVPTTTETTTTTTTPPLPTVATDGRNLGHCSDGSCTVDIRVGDSFKIGASRLHVMALDAGSVTFAFEYPDGTYSELSFGTGGGAELSGPDMPSISMAMSKIGGGHGVLVIRRK